MATERRRQSCGESAYPEASITDIDLQKITAVFHKEFYVLIPNALLSFKLHLKW